jgi:hypothetical protein
MSLLGTLFGGVLSIVLWFEVASEFHSSILQCVRNDRFTGTADMTSGERAGFVVAGLVETLLFIASVLG